jgi:hypothetical protein
MIYGSFCMDELTISPSSRRNILEVLRFYSLLQEEMPQKSLRTLSTVKWQEK